MHSNCTNSPLPIYIASCPGHSSLHCHRKRKPGIKTYSQGSSKSHAPRPLAQALSWYYPALSGLQMMTNTKHVSTYDIWHIYIYMPYDIWPYDIWHMTYVIWHMTHVTYDIGLGHMTHDMCHMTYDIWHMAYWHMTTYDIWHINILWLWHRHMTYDIWLSDMTYDNLIWHMTYDAIWLWHTYDIHMTYDWHDDNDYWVYWKPEYSHPFPL